MARNANPCASPSDWLSILNNLCFSSDSQNLGIPNKVSEELAAAIIHKHSFGISKAEYSKGTVDENIEKINAAGTEWYLFMEDCDKVIVFIKNSVYNLF